MLLRENVQNIFGNRTLALVSGPSIGIFAGGMARLSDMKYEMSSVLGLCVCMIIWWLNEGKCVFA
jgi:hypothetical protein